MPSVIGLAAFNARLLNFIRALPDEVERALQAEAEEVLKVAKSRTPVKTGALRASGVLQEPVKAGFMTAQPITFGDPTPYYAIFVHENLEARHPNGGQSKFLESAVMDAMPGLSVRIGQRINIERMMTR